jgi:hypothetical protein
MKDKYIIEYAEKKYYMTPEDFYKTPGFLKGTVIMSPDGYKTIVGLTKPNTNVFKQIWDMEEENEHQENNN